MYDGAGNMAGCVNGTATLITNEYPQALYLHCASHCLNLAVVKSFKVTSVHNMMNVVERVYHFLLHIQNDEEHLETLSSAVFTKQLLFAWRVLQCWARFMDSRHTH